LASSGLTAASVARALRQADAKVASGVVRNQNRNVLIELEGELDSLDRIRNVPVRVADGSQILRVGDLARVELSVQDPPSDLAIVDGSPAVVVAAKMAKGIRFDAWSAKAWKAIGEFEAMLPDGVVLETVFDQTIYTRARLSELLGNLMTGLLLVVVILFLTMGWRAAVIVALTLPLVSMASVTVLLLMDVPIHQMSVTGLIVALGLLVDNAIVVTDQIRMRRATGMASAQAVSETIGRLWLPLLSSTATTVLGFMPILLLPGRVGEFVGTIALSVIIALISSFAFAMTITAAVAGKFIPAREHSNSVLSRGLEFPKLGRAFDRSMAWSLRRPKTSMALASILPLIGFIGTASLPKQFFPPADRNQINIELRVARQASIDRTLGVTTQADAILRGHEAVEAVSWFVGKSAPPFYYNLRQSQDGNSSYAQAQVTV
ncbi:MAG: efflux RND transporter permease subunit, partial [Myxococcota bacterium]